MNEQIPFNTDLDRAFHDLKADLLNEGGPSISIIRNRLLAIVVYKPADELDLRRRTRRLAAELSAGGWVVHTLSLAQLLLRRISALGPDFVQRTQERERRLYARAPERGLNYLRDTLARHIEGPDGIAADVSAEIVRFAEEHPDKKDRTLALIGRAGALYPFFRCSALLKHIDGRTLGVPVILLYPGERCGESGLSFMERLPADRDYRARLYP